MTPDLTRLVVADAKRFSTLQAKLALRGFVLIRTDDDAGGPLYIVSKWALTRQLHSLSEIEAFVQRVTER